MSVYVSVHQIRPLPGSDFDGGIQFASVQAFVKADNADDALAISERQIVSHGWETVALLSMCQADPSSEGARVAEKQKWQFWYDVKGVEPGFFEKKPWLLDDGDEDG